MESNQYISPYSPNTDADRRKMLGDIGVESSDILFNDIPDEYRNPSLNLPKPLSELELKREIEGMAHRNKVPGEYISFLGAGSYRHHIPAIVGYLASRSEFMTGYTPYQPEVSQGTLQAHYEFQSMICQLTGMEVANAGMYDGATSVAEAILMAVRITGKNGVAVLETVSNAYKEVVSTYSQALGVNIYSISEDCAGEKDDTACVVVQQPNFFGYMEDLEKLTKDVHSNGSLLIVVADPISLGLFKPPGDYDADIVVGEGQGLGVTLSFGGPYVGIFSCKKKYIRQMPGRIVGRTVDSNGKDGFVLTLQTREQHIRREKATSNICTSVGLIALMSTIYMAAQGRNGLRHIAELCYHKAHYAASLISDIPGYSLPINGIFFREFVIQCPADPTEVNRRLLDYGIIGGLDVSDNFTNGMLLCCTELNSKEEINSLVKALKEIGESEC